jgi:hypothetical protein
VAGIGSRPDANPGAILLDLDAKNVTELFEDLGVTLKASHFNL